MRAAVHLRVVLLEAGILQFDEKFDWSAMPSKIDNLSIDGRGHLINSYVPSIQSLIEKVRPRNLIFIRLKFSALPGLLDHLKGFYPVASIKKIVFIACRGFVDCLERFLDMTKVNAFGNPICNIQDLSIDKCLGRNSLNTALQRKVEIISFLDVTPCSLRNVSIINIENNYDSRKLHLDGDILIMDALKANHQRWCLCQAAFRMVSLCWRYGEFQNPHECNLGHLPREILSLILTQVSGSRHSLVWEKDGDTNASLARDYDTFRNSHNRRFERVDSVLKFKHLHPSIQPDRILALRTIIDSVRIVGDCTVDKFQPYTRRTLLETIGTCSLAETKYLMLENMDFQIKPIFYSNGHYMGQFLYGNSKSLNLTSANRNQSRFELETVKLINCKNSHLFVSNLVYCFTEQDLQAPNIVDHRKEYIGDSYVDSSLVLTIDHESRVFTIEPI